VLGEPRFFLGVPDELQDVTWCHRLLLALVDFGAARHIPVRRPHQIDWVEALDPEGAATRLGRVRPELAVVAADVGALDPGLKKGEE